MRRCDRLGKAQGQGTRTGVALFKNLVAKMARLEDGDARTSTIEGRCPPIRVQLIDVRTHASLSEAEENYEAHEVTSLFFFLRCPR